MIEVRKANINDINCILKLLSQVLEVHHKGRPDLFKCGAVKYTKEELADILSDESRPVFVATDTDNEKEVLGYCFCIYRQEIGNNILTDIRTLYIDDLCVDENMRGRRIGETLYNYVVDFAKREGFYNITLNVWALNGPAIGFYEKMGLCVQKLGMEKIL